MSNFQRLILKTKKRKFLAGGAEEEDTAVIALVGCKCDLVSQRAVQYNEALVSSNPLCSSCSF